MAAPKIIPYDVELRSVNPVRSFDRPKAYTNDLNSVEFQFKILDMTSTELTTATAVTLVYMRDGSFFANPSTDVSRVGNVFSYLLKENEGNHAGVAQIQLVVTVDGMELASQLFDFEIINGLETKVAQEVMIYDWTTLTRDAQDYIDQFVSNEATRQQQFADAQTARTNTFTQSETDRTTAFDNSQTTRTNAYTAAEAARDADFDEAEGLRATAETGRVSSESSRVTAETGRTTAETNRATAETNRATAEGNRVTAESGRVTAESNRVTAETNRAAAFTAFDTRLQAEETATAANKISAVKGKTFADVDARLEDLETDGAFMASNGVTNGDFSNGTTNWLTDTSSSKSVANNTLTSTANGSTNLGDAYQMTPFTAGRKYYVRAKFRVTNALCTAITLRSNYTIRISVTPVLNEWYSRSSVFTGEGETLLRFRHTYPDAATALGNSMEIQYVLILDLTTIFGAGKEPTAAEMDRILARFTNSWFDGTKNLFLARTAIEKQMQLDAGAIMDAKNLVLNGDISNGSVGWASTTAGTVSAVAGQLELVGNGSISAVQAFSESATETSVANNKYYVSAAITTNSKVTGVKIGVQSKVTWVFFQKYVYPTVGVQTKCSEIVTPTVSETFRVLIDFNHASTADATGSTVKIDNVMLLNLTASFGAGNEPTVEQMDAIMAKFENSWFDGTKNLFQAKASLSKLMALDARTEFDARNEVLNGDFKLDSNVDGIADNFYSATVTSPSVSGGVQSFTASAQYGAIAYSSAFGNSSDKYYIFADVKALSSLVNLRSSNPNVTKYHSGGGAFERLSLISQLASGTGNIRVVDSRSSGWDTVQMKNFGAINLTQAFGAGKEPTLAEMDRLMARFPNSWFDGMKSIQTIEQLYQEKANKVQEAWITPTLLNGWVNFDDGVSYTTCAYMKSTIGFVTLKGMLKSGSIGMGTPAFTLPVGCRPSKRLKYPVVSNGAFGEVDINVNGDVGVIFGNNAYVNLDSITFRAEQ